VRDHKQHARKESWKIDLFVVTTERMRTRLANVYLSGTVAQCTIAVLRPVQNSYGIRIPLVYARMSNNGAFSSVVVQMLRDVLVRAYTSYGGSN
jgi:hypothetical protein